MELSLSSHRFISSSSSSSSSSSPSPSLPSLFNSRIKVSQTPLFSLRNYQQKLQLFTGLHHKLPTSMEPQTTIPHAFDNGSFITSSETGRIGEVKRTTKETNVHVKINLDGTGVAENSSGIPFLDHMLDQLASHGLFDVHVKATGDIHIDDHHTNEDVALAIGTALLQALGDRKGINRFGDFSAPLDEALVHVSLLRRLVVGNIYVLYNPSRKDVKLGQDLSGRPHLNFDVQIPTQRVGTYDTQLVEHFFQSLVNTSGMTLHIRQLAGKNSHHIIEATFKAFARALRQATEYDLRRGGSVPSSKGVLSRS